MNRHSNLRTAILEHNAEKRLLKHPFYQAWEMGEVPPETLKTYAKQYFHHVDTFPRYLSAMHSRCEDAAARQEILKNLMDEELGDNNHPELWVRFAEGLGVKRDAIAAEKAKLLPETQNLIDTFVKLCNSSYAEGLAALYIYEEQTPEIAARKSAGLRKHYGVTSDRALSYFTLHEKMDVEHSNATGELLEKLPPEDHAKAMAAAESAYKALWGFLDGTYKLMQ